MFEIMRTTDIFADWPDGLVTGRCDILFHRISDEPDIIHVWLEGIFEVNSGLIVVLKELPNIPNGIYRLPCFLFYPPQDKRYCRAVMNPHDVYLYDIVKLDYDLVVASPEESQDALDKWESSVTIGDGNDMDDIQHCEAHFVCADCLITKPVRVGPAELYPLQPTGVIDLASSVKEALLFQGIRNVPLDEIGESIANQSDRRSPLFVMSFHRIMRNDKEVILPLMPFIKQVFGILCLNRGSYSRLLGCIYLKRRKGSTQPTYANLNSYYRGNLSGGIISREQPDLWNKQYILTKGDKFKTEIMSKLNSAHAETDLDIAYFRFWAILESVCYYVTGHKDLKSVREICRRAYDPQDIEQVAKVSLGGHEFKFTELSSMWHDWRNLTAHHGGIYAHYTGTRKAHNGNVRMIEAMKSLNMPLEYGEDRSIFILKDVCTQVVSAFITNKLT